MSNKVASLENRRRIEEIRSDVDRVETFAQSLKSGQDVVAKAIHQQGVRLSETMAIAERAARAAEHAHQALDGFETRLGRRFDALDARIDKLTLATGRLADEVRRGRERDRELEKRADSARAKASGARRLFDGLNSRQSHLEAEWQAKVGIAIAEGNAKAESREERQRIVATLTSAPVALAIIAAIGGAGLWAVLGALVALTFAFIYLARTRRP